jgi:hypothetical protein
VSTFAPYRRLSNQPVPVARRSARLDASGFKPLQLFPSRHRPSLGDARSGIISASLLQYPSHPVTLMSNERPGIAKLFQGVVSRLLLYYGALLLIVWGVWAILSESSRVEVTTALAPILGVGGASVTVGVFSKSDAIREMGGLPPHLVTLLASVACVAAVLLSLPVAWTYMFTRQKKGYSQSVVHTLVLLPAVVAAVAVLVRNSVALAFSLAGIVAAVRFRTTLEDSKDAVFVFVVVALGLACGVQIEVAIVLSLLYIVLALTLWQTDFARTPPGIEGKRAELHMQRAMAIANRTSQFVARLDKEILETMAPEQLDALATRVRKRREEIGIPEQGENEEDRPKFDGRVTVVVSDSEGAQAVVESILTERSKRWTLVRTDSSDGELSLVYSVRAKKGGRLDEVAQVIQRDGVPYVSKAKAEQWM